MHWSIRNKLLLLCLGVVLCGFALESLLTGVFYRRVVDLYSQERVTRLATFMSGVMQWWFDGDEAPDPGDSDWLRSELGPAQSMVYRVDLKTGRYSTTPVWKSMKSTLPPLDPEGLQTLARNMQVSEVTCICGAYRVASKREWKYIVQVALPLSIDQQNMQGFRQTTLLVGGGVFLLVGLLTWLIAQSITRPLEELSDRARKLEKSPVFPHQQRKDEVGVLSRALQEGLQEVQSAREREKRFLAAASHELRTPITALLLSIEQDARKARTMQDHEKTLSRVHATALRLRELSSNLLTLVKPQSASHLTLDFTLMVGEVIDELMPMAAEKGLWLEFNGDPVQFSGDPHALRQMVTNLVSNSIKFTAQGEIQVHIQSQPEGFLLTVADTGMGFPGKAEDLFQPFARGSGAAQWTAGSGLGLAVVQEVVQAHQGNIALKNRETGGALASVWLPHRRKHENPDH